MPIPTLMASAYLDAHVWEQERARIFGRQWLVATAAARIPRPGDAIALTLAGWPLVLVRGDDGQVRAFHNVCRHRAGPLVFDGETDHGPRLRCRYHAWTYDLQGRRLSTPDFGADCPAADLHAACTQVWRGLVFVRIGSEGPPLDEALGDLPDACRHLDLESFRFSEHVVHELACNWKVYVENYLEGYHIPAVHPGLARDTDLRRYRVHVGKRHITHEVPMRAADAAYQGFWAWLWPSVAINVYGEGLSIESIVPTGPQTMQIRYDFLFREGCSDDARARARATSDEVTREDIRIVEAVQKGLASGVYTTGWLSPRHERGVAAFQQWITQALST